MFPWEKRLGLFDDWDSNEQRVIYFSVDKNLVNLVNLHYRFFGTQDFPDLNLGIQDFKATPLWVFRTSFSSRVFLHQDAVFSNEIWWQEMFGG